MENSSTKLFVVVGIAVIIFVVLFMMSQSEGFSKSGLTMSDEYCDKLSNAYYLKNIPQKDQRICGRQRKGLIDKATGNY